MTASTAFKVGSLHYTVETEGDPRDPDGHAVTVVLRHHVFRDDEGVPLYCDEDVEDEGKELHRFTFRLERVRWEACAEDVFSSLEEEKPHWLDTNMHWSEVVDRVASHHPHLTDLTAQGTRVINLLDFQDYSPHVHDDGSPEHPPWWELVTDAETFGHYHIIGRICYDLLRVSPLLTLHNRGLITATVSGWGTPSAQRFISRAYTSEYDEEPMYEGSYPEPSNNISRAVPAFQRLAWEVG